MRVRWKTISPWFLYFFIYAVFGWAYEIFLEVVIYRWGYSDRGVLFGPYCPVYGVGAIVFLLCFRSLVIQNQPWKLFRSIKPLLVFVGCMLLATAIELGTSYLLEAITGSWPWQTYVDYTINFQGRIALSPSIRFGFGGLLFLYILQPLFERFVGRMSPKIQQWMSAVLLILFLMDCAATLLLG